MSKKKVLLRGVFINRDTNGEGVLKVGTTLIRVSTVMGILYPQRKLIPFARRDDGDDIACFEVGKENRVQIIHDFASAGYEQRKEYECFWDWFRDAVEEMINKDECDG